MIAGLHGLPIFLLEGSVEFGDEVRVFVHKFPFVEGFFRCCFIFFQNLN